MKREETEREDGKEEAEIQEGRGEGKVRRVKRNGRNFNGRDLQRSVGQRRSIKKENEKKEKK